MTCSTNRSASLLHRLAVFVGGWTLEAAEQVGQGEAIEEWEVLDLLTSLTDKSLCQSEERAGVTRYRLLETVRQYAAEKLAASGEADTIRLRHRDYFLHWAESIGTAREMDYRPEKLEPELDNLRGALDFCRESEEGAEPGLRLVNSTFNFWWHYTYVKEARQMLEDALAHPRATQTSHWWDARLFLAFLTPNDTGQSMGEECLAAYRQAQDRAGEACALHF